MPEINKFLCLHNCDLSDVLFECDGDSRKFFTHKSLSPNEEDYGHSLADVAAFYDNEGDMKIDGLITINIAKKIKDKLELKFKRR